MLQIELNMYQAVAVAALVLLLGRFLVSKIPFLTKFVIPEQYFYTQQGKICEKIRYKECEDGKGIVPDVDFRGMKRRIRNRKNQVRSVFAEDVPGS